MTPLVFVHVRKNAGSAIKQFFGEVEYPLIVADEFPTDFLNGHITFGVMRDPFDRVISSWKYCQSTRNRTLLEALMDPPKETDHHPGLTQGHDYRHFTKLQSDYLYDCDRERRVRHILRYERLEKDLGWLCNRYNVPAKKLPLANIGKHRLGYSPAMLTNKEKQLIVELYNDDFELLGYNPDV